MKKRSAGLDRCGRILKTVLIMTNAGFVILGIMILASGAYISADRLYFTTPVYGLPIIAASAYFFLAAGILLVVISFIGCVAALYEKRSLLLMYTMVLCAVFMLLFTAISLAIVFRSWVREQVITYMTDILQQQYGVKLNNTYNAWVTKSWDAAQERWYCCGVRDQNWGVYKASRWYQEQPGIPDSTRVYVPQSCCVKNQYGAYMDLNKCQLFQGGPPARQSNVKNECLFFKGCYEAGKEALYSISLYITITGLIVCLFMLGGIGISLNLYRRV